MSNKIADVFQQQVTDPGPVLKIVNTIAAALGISSFLGLVNLLVGVLSVGWLVLQGYGYIVYELPTKRAKKLRAEFMARQATAATEPGDL